MKTYKVALLSGPIFSNNMGCNALTYGSLNVLSAVAAKLNIQFEYYLIGNPADGVVPPELNSYEIHFIEQMPDFGPMGLLRGIYRHNLNDRKREARLLKEVDIFCDNAWGDSFSDIYGLSRFHTVYQNLTYALKSRKPLILLPQTIGPFKSDSVKIKAAKLLRSASVVYARDPLSLTCALQISPGVEVYETIDVALFMDYEKRLCSSLDGLTVGINPSGLLWKGGYTGNNQFGLREDYQGLIRKIVTYLLSLDGVSVEFIGHDIKGPNAGNLREDYAICKLLQREFPACQVGPFFYSPVEAKSYISGLDLLIGSRMHCCIAAYSSGVPVFPLAYSRKFRGLFADKLGYEHLSDLMEDDCQTVLCGLENLLGKIEKVKTQMPERLDCINEYKNELVNHLASKLSILLK